MASDRISVRISEELSRRVRATVEREDATISEVVRSLLAAWADEDHPVFGVTGGNGEYQFGGVEWWAKTMAMSLEELVGAILARSQVIEEFMRHYIASESSRVIEQEFMRHYIASESSRVIEPHEVKGTFGVLKDRFRQLFPDEARLLAALDDANEVRNDAAHSNVLVASFVTQVLEGYDPQTVDRFTRKGVRKSLYVMNDALVLMVDFYGRHPLAVGDA